MKLVKIIFLLCILFPSTSFADDAVTVEEVKNMCINESILSASAEKKKVQIDAAAEKKIRIFAARIAANNQRIWALNSQLAFAGDNFHISMVNHVDGFEPFDMYINNNTRAALDRMNNVYHKIKAVAQKNVAYVLKQEQIQREADILKAQIDANVELCIDVDNPEKD